MARALCSALIASIYVMAGIPELVDLAFNVTAGQIDTHVLMTLAVFGTLAIGSALEVRLHVLTCLSSVGPPELPQGLMASAALLAPCQAACVDTGDVEVPLSSDGCHICMSLGAQSCCGQLTKLGQSVMGGSEILKNLLLYSAGFSSCCHKFCSEVAHRPVMYQVSIWAGPRSRGALYSDRGSWTQLPRHAMSLNLGISPQPLLSEPGRCIQLFRLRGEARMHSRWSKCDQHGAPADT